MDLNQVTVVCTDYEASVTFYRKLGLTQIVDSPPRYARFETPGGATLSIHGGAAGSAGTVSEQGLEFESQPVDQAWLWREAYLCDPAGNRLCIYHAGDNRRYPPWRLPGEDG
jgi:catechol 2,3-dioxygenase-like lactoylglutathione lyase family enzyme